MPEADHYTLKQFTRKLETTIQAQEEHIRKIKGVHLERLRKKKKNGEVKQSIHFRADIKRGGVMYFLGRFHSAEQAIQRRKDAENAWEYWKRQAFSEEAKPDYVVNKESKSFRSLTPQKKVNKGRLVPVDEWFFRTEDLEDWQWAHLEDGGLREYYITPLQRKKRWERRLNNRGEL